MLVIPFNQQGTKTKKILELVNIPGIHIPLGVADKILKENEKSLFENKEYVLQFVNRYLSKINIWKVSYQKAASFGRQCLL